MAADLGEDVFDHPEEHSFGECEAETMQQLRRVRGAPEALASADVDGGEFLPPEAAAWIRA